MSKEGFNQFKNEGKNFLIDKKYEDARRSYKEALSQSIGDVPRRELAIVYHNLGVCSINLNHNDEALGYMNEAIEQDATYFKSFYRKANLLLQMKDFTQALQIVQQLMTKEPCKEVFELKKLITETMLKNSNIYDFEVIKRDLMECSSEKDVHKVYADLYNRPEDMESYHAILDEERGFCQQLIELLLRDRDKVIPSSLMLGLKFVHSIWSRIKFHLKEKRFFIPGWLTQMLMDYYGYLVRDNQSSKKQEIVQLYFSLLCYSNLMYSNVLPQIQKLIMNDSNQFLNKTLFDISRMFALNFRYCEKCNPEELQVICNERDKFIVTSQGIVEYCALYLKQNFTSRDGEFDCENEQVHLTWELMISLLKISDQLQSKLASIKINIQDAFSFKFFSKDYYSKKNLLQLIALVGCNQTKFNQMSQLYDMPNKILRTIIQKKEQMSSIDLIKYFLSLVLKDDDFTKKLSESVYTVYHQTQLKEQTNNILQDYLRTYSKDEAYSSHFKFVVKYLSILFQINTRAKFHQLYEYLLLIDCQKFLEKLFQSDTMIHDSLTLLTYIASFDDAKKIMMKGKNILKIYIDRTNDKLKEMKSLKDSSTLHKIQIYSCSVILIQFLFTLCLDQSRDYKEEQKEKFGIDDEQYNMARELEKKYKPEGSVDNDIYFKYDEHFIQKHKVLAFVGLQLNTIGIISDFLCTYDEQMTEYTKHLIAQILARLSQEDSLVPHLFDKRSLRLVARLCLQPNYKQANDGYVYLSKVLCSANPNLFEYKDVHIFVDALLSSAISSKHELQIFQSLLGVVQLSSLGDDICWRLASTNQIVQIQNFLLEENHYIEHAALQILNNVALSTKFQQQMEEQHLSNFYKILKAILEMEYDRLLKYYLGDKLKQQYDDENIVPSTDFSHPLKIMQTLLSLFAIYSFSPLFRQTTLEQYPLLQDQEFYSHILIILKDQDKYVQFDLIHKLVCLLDNYNLKDKLIKQVILLKDLFHLIHASILTESPGDALVKDKIQKITQYLKE